jgi:hypothetical protein
VKRKVINHASYRMNKIALLLIGSLSLVIFASAPMQAKEVFTGEKLNRPFTVHGRLSIYNGSSNMRIWIVGSKRLLYIDAESSSLKKLNEIFADGNNWWTRDIFADFTVEPLAPDIKGHMRPVRVVAVKRVVVTQGSNVILQKETL